MSISLKASGNDLNVSHMLEIADQSTRAATEHPHILNLHIKACAPLNICIIVSLK